jgi:predicted nucleic acid-binding protein
VIKIAVTDANIFIDLLALDLIGAFFKLDLEIYTTEEVLLELYPSDRDNIVAFGRITIDTTSSKDQRVANTLSAHFSLADRSLLQLVYHKQAILISGEKRMRSWCKKNSIEVHGIIWVLELIVAQGHITSNEAADHLAFLLSINDWLPTNICLEKIEYWKSFT